MVFFVVVVVDVLLQAGPHRRDAGPGQHGQQQRVGGARARRQADAAGQSRGQGALDPRQIREQGIPRRAAVAGAARTAARRGHLQVTHIGHAFPEEPVASYKLDARYSLLGLQKVAPPPRVLQVGRNV